ncbi:MAG: FtsX-like permease family protein [Clostridium sp.]
MGSLKFALKMVLSDMKQSICYTVATFLAVTVIFNIFNIIYNPEVMGENILKTIDVSIIALLVILACVLFISFANSYYLIEKTKDVAVAAISGRTFVEVAIILCVQNLGLGLIGTVLGITIGSLLVPFFVGTLYSSLGVIGNINVISKESYVFTFIIMGMQFLAIGLIDAGYAYRKEIKELMNMKSGSANRDTTPFKKVPNKFFIVLYLLPLITFLFGLEAKEASVIMGVLLPIGIVGAAFILQIYIPCEIVKIRRKVKDPVKFISLSNLHYSIKKSGFLIISLMIGTLALMGNVASSITEQLRIISLCAYYLVMFLMNIALIYKFIGDAFSKIQNYKQLKLIGYNLNQIKRIIRDEIVFFFGIEIVITSVLLLSTILPCYVGGALSLKASIAAFLSFLIMQGISIVISYFSYKNIVIKEVDI